MKPAGVPQAVVCKLKADIEKLRQEPKLRETLARGGADASTDTSTATFARLLQSEYNRHLRLVKEAGSNNPQLPLRVRRGATWGAALLIGSERE